ncbi:MAG: DUF2849 domain-containing protein [Parasphingorhabdus sp.]|nr:DUF2849 domain-containing protein [Parasphingorhabdus sp.]
MKILTGNDLATGDVLWWTGLDWSRHISDAADAGEEAETIMAKEEAARRVNAAFIIDAQMTPEGPRPAHIMDRVRALGPTVRPDLALKSSTTDTQSWII